MRSTSSNPQIWRCKRTTDFRSSRSVRGRMSIMRLGLLPERLHLWEGCAGQSCVAFYKSETLAELRIGLAQRLLGIHFQESRQIHQDEQHIAELAFKFRGRAV